MAGAVGFAAGVIVYLLSGPDWVIAALTQAPAPVAGIVMAAPFGFGAAALAGAAREQPPARTSAICIAPRLTT